MNLFFSSSPATDTLTPSDMLRDNQTLVSSGGLFEFGFFDESVSGYYLGIWFTADPSNVVWVGNIDFPLLDSSALLQIRSGNLILTDRRQVQSIVNSGNVATTSIIWQSFDAPSDTNLPGMKLGSFNLNTDHQNLQVVNSWASHQNPARGLYTLSIDSSDLTKLSVWRGDGVKMVIAFLDEYEFRFIFENSNGSTNDYDFSLQFNRNEAFYTFSSSKNYDLMWLVMNSTGNLDQNFMLKGKIYSVSHPLCAGSNGGNNGTCLPSIPSQCKDGGAFSEMNGSLPSTSAGSGGSIGISECQTLCQVNCSCTAFASVQNESVCQLYYGSKQNLLKIVEGPGLIYIRDGAPSGKINPVFRVL
ncbi:S-locus lectin protein kinase family protein [Prunus dulcis]|uniref:S-locus lectin protein kinase family protein n=1 Tax=Prunus dulcis TaxID=3755 RepID=A0A5H2XZF6_PRUDU|nr:S-locus lectin protein kinase family protein [Prunus dulcis]